jgi:glutathione S-transferase
MIELLQFRPAFGLMNASPFCMKVEVFLRLAELEYRCANDALPMRTPKGKLPVIRDGEVLVADSQAIIVHLQQQHAGRIPPALRAPETAQALALRRMLEESCYFALLWLRWIDEPGWQLTGPAFFGHLPWPLRSLVPWIVRRKMRHDLQGQGMGRHSRDEICARAVADLRATSDLLGMQPFFGGDSPAAIDASAYAFLANVLWVPIDNPVKAKALQLPRLAGYCERMQDLVGR